MSITEMSITKVSFTKMSWIPMMPDLTNIQVDLGSPFNTSITIHQAAQSC